jgi:hypothetical protein
VEEPIPFDLWCRVLGQPPAAAPLWLRDQRIGLSLLAAKLEIARATQPSTPHLLVAEGVGWLAVTTLRSKLPEWLHDPVTLQHRYQPNEPLDRCRIHDLRYGGCLGCHVCQAACVP